MTVKVKKCVSPNLQPVPGIQIVVSVKIKIAAVNIEL